MSAALTWDSVGPWYAEMAKLYAALIVAEIPFAQANYGDGEWACILGRDGSNVNGEEYGPALSEELAETLRRPVPGMLYGTNPGKRLRDDVSRWAFEQGIDGHGVDLPWVFKDALSSANVHGDLGAFFRALATRRLGLIGPPHLEDLDERVLGPDVVRAECHPTAAWEQADALTAATVQMAHSCSVILYACGMASNLIIHRAWRRLQPLGVTTLIDVGAILDPYCGVTSRKGYRRPEWAQTKEANLP